MILRVQFCDPCNGNIDILDAIPGTSSDNAVLRQIKDALEHLHGIFGRRSIDAVHADLWNQRIIVGNRIELLLDLAHGVPGGTDAQGVARIGGWNAGDFLRRIDINRVAVVVAEDLNGGVSLIGKILRTPLTHPVRTGNPVSVTVLRQDRLLYIRAREIGVKNFVHHLRNALKNISSVDPFVVEGGGGGDGKVKALVAVPLGIR